MDVYENLRGLGIELPDALPPAGLYKPVNQFGNLLFVSGQGSIRQGMAITGRCGVNLSVEQCQEAAYVCGVNTIAALHHYLGDLNKLRKCVKIMGFVAGGDDFTEQAKVINGCSQLFFDVFGEDGCHARSAIGTNSLPLGLAVEVESIWEIAQSD